MALYWAIMTLTGIGYGDITPQNHFEYWVASACMLLSGGLWAFTIGEVCGVVTNLLPHDVALKKEVDELNWLMADRGVNEARRREMRRYVYEARMVKRIEEQKSVVQNLSPMLQGQVLGSMMEGFCTKVSFLRSMHDTTVVALSMRLKSRLYAPGEEIAPSRSLNLVRRGIGARAGRLLTIGDVWGTDLLLTDITLRESNFVRCLSYFEVLSLPAEALFAAVENNPPEFAKLRWAQVRLALWRGIRLICYTGRMLRNNSGIGLEHLGDDDIFKFYREVLGGTFDKWEPALRRKMSKRLSTRDIVSEAPAAPTEGRGAAPGAAQPDIAQMKASMEALVRQMDALIASGRAG
mmetsp:Transcript_47237/g.131560  ORF Transcript_47237/g.131560 Transcript_47237/m.131560 type:complete len:350 (-) Transcript_47237:133-1182(-)